MSSRPSAALESTAAAPLAPFSPFSRLRFELVTQIIESCVPLSFHSTTYEERQKNLRSLCLVSRLFQQIAKPLLETVVYSRSDQHFRQWLQDQRHSTDGGVVRELVLLSDGTDLAADLQLVSQSQRHLTTLVLEGLLETVDLADLDPLKSLVRLSISMSALSISRPFTLPLLVEMSWMKILALSNVALDDRSLKAAFPSLRALTLDGNITPVSDSHPLESVLGALSQQVDVIQACIDTLRSRPSIFAALKDKTLFDFYRFSLLKSTTRSVNARLLYDPYNAHDVAFLPDLVSALGGDPNLSQLSLLYLPPVLSEKNVCNSADNLTRQDLLNLCRDRKIEVVSEDTTGDRYVDSFVSGDFWRRRRELRRAGEGP